MKNIIIILCCLVLLPFRTLSVSARGIMQNLVVESTGLPVEAVYMDMLIFMDVNDVAYTPFNVENMKQYDFDTKALAEYNNDGFISMSCHYKDNFTRMPIQTNARGEYINAFTLEIISDGSFGQNARLVNKLMEEKRRFRIALLDQNGNIIQVSKPFVCSGKKGDLISDVKYDAEKNKLSLYYEYSGAPLWWVRAIKPSYVIIGIIVIIAILKFFIYKLKYFIMHNHNKE